MELKLDDYRCVASDLNESGLDDFLFEKFLSIRKGVDDVIVVELVGGAASGKTSMLNRLKEIGGLKLDFLGTDDYVVGDRDFRRKNLEGEDPRKKYDFHFLKEKIVQIKNLDDGDFVKVPKYDSFTGLAVAAGEDSFPKKVFRVDFLVVEGDFAFVESPDYKIYFHVDDEVRLQNRILRDVGERNSGSEADVVKNFELRQKLQHYPYTFPELLKSDLVIVVDVVRREELGKNFYEYQYKIYEKMNIVYLFDVDSTLVNANHVEAMEAVRLEFKRLVPEKAEVLFSEFKKIRSEMNDVFHERILREDSEIYRALNEYEVVFSKKEEEHSIEVMWSRDLWVYYIDKKYDLGLTDEEIMGVAQVYWDGVGEFSKIYDDVFDLFDKVGRKYVVTASDHRLKFENGKIVYDSEFSRESKFRRLRQHGLLEIFGENEVFIGDPYDKPSSEFWDMVVLKLGALDLKKVVVVDDNRNVVLRAVDYGFSGVLIDRKLNYSNLEGDYKYIDNFDEFDL